MKNFIFLIFLITFYSGHCQKKYPQNYFRNPLDIPIRLAGTFGELRANHFHAGLDIKTNGRKGLKVYASADGYVSRIKVALWGYGKVIYVTHSNGYTSVYAHLSKFSDDLEKYVKKFQYQKQSYETGNIFPKKGELLVKKGEVIGYSGNTGGFIAPHLHFEIRDTKTEHIINPMLFGLTVKDTIAPIIQQLMVYPIDANSRIKNSSLKQILAIKKTSPNTYVTNRIKAFGNIGFGIRTIDKLGSERNPNGVYSIEVLVNGKRHYYHDLETFSFAESKYINLLIDYEYNAKYKKRLQKTFKEKANKLSIYEDLIENGFINIKPGMNYMIKILVKDFDGNTSSVRIPVAGGESNVVFAASKDSTKYKITKDKFHKFQEKGVTVAFPKNTFYNDDYIDFKVSGKVATVHKPTIPLDKNFTITFDSTMYKNENLDKIYIANINNEKYPKYQYTRKRDDKVFTTSKTLGKYTLLIDNQKPKIYSPNFKTMDWTTNLKYLTIKISDNESGIKSFNAFIDDEWVLMEYDLRRKRLSYDFSDKKLVGSKHIFKLVVSDNVGNIDTFTSTFFRK